MISGQVDVNQFMQNEEERMEAEKTEDDPLLMALRTLKKIILKQEPK